MSENACCPGSDSEEFRKVANEFKATCLEDPESLFNAVIRALVRVRASAASAFRERDENAALLERVMEENDNLINDRDAARRERDEWKTEFNTCIGTLKLVRMRLERLERMVCRSGDDLLALGI